MKRKQLLRELRKLARAKHVDFRIVTTLGKGSHITVYFGDRVTIIKDGELAPGYVRLVKKQLGV